ncbi:hypothetical protein L596_015977 [Steinernema carpocapsae]|uniref:Uncharacterized protein n=1 Tax=Steinernema carpocapsae TaxID=34508 RepID=A0A4U5NHM1_STECR|nr:hypothetical protein L596_015977 [Steinernema carpocapsae]
MKAMDTKLKNASCVRCHLPQKITKNFLSLINTVNISAIICIPTFTVHLTHYGNTPRSTDLLTKRSPQKRALNKPVH